jgi:hypothetical protein
VGGRGREGREGGETTTGINGSNTFWQLGWTGKVRKGRREREGAIVGIGYHLHNQLFSSGCGCGCGGSEVGKCVATYMESFVIGDECKPLLASSIMIERAKENTSL